MENTFTKKFSRNLMACLVTGSLLVACGGDSKQSASNNTALLASATTGTMVAPYFATWNFGDSSFNASTLMDAKNKVGLNAVTLAFVLAGSSCALDSGGQTIDTTMSSDIAAFQAAGGTVIISFGGQAGTYLEQKCTSSQMASLIDGLIQRHNFRHLDFDVEGSKVTTALGTVRNGAIKTLQTKYPDLYVSFTLAAMPDTGLDSTGVSLLKQAVAAGINVNVVNIMAMDYGLGGDMGQYGISAANATAAQLASVYPSKTTAQRLSMVGITSLIGKQDSPDPGVFTVANASTTATFAKANNLPLVSYWVFQRDAAGGSPANDNGSGAQTANFQFYNAFKAAGGGGTTTTTGATTTTTKASTTTTKAGTTTTKAATTTTQAATTTTTQTTTTTTSATGTLKNVYGAADTFVRDGSNADTNYGTSTLIQVKTSGTSGDSRTGFLKFNMGSNLPGITKVKSAKLKIYGSSSGATVITAYQYGAPGSTWTETALTWNNALSLGAGLATANLGTTAQQIEFDVTSYVNVQIAGGGSYVTLAIKENSGSAGHYTTFNSRESGVNKPILEIIY